MSTYSGSGFIPGSMKATIYHHNMDGEGGTEEPVLRKSDDHPLTFQMVQRAKSFKAPPQDIMVDVEAGNVGRDLEEAQEMIDTQNSVVVTSSSPTGIGEVNFDFLGLFSGTKQHKTV